jgi:hypothetical protein
MFVRTRARPSHKTDNLTSIREPMSQPCRPRRLAFLGAVRWEAVAVTSGQQLLPSGPFPWLTFSPEMGTVRSSVRR